MIRLLQVVTYIFYCIRLRVGPWKYFQLNANYFNEQRGIFSKLDMDQLIPDQWRLNQFLDIENRYPSNYPVFIKPEWGQNSHGIYRADNPEALKNIRLNRMKTTLNYLIQDAASGKREFEVFLIPSTMKPTHPAILSVTETINTSDEYYPINGIYNKSCRYQDITDQFNRGQLKTLWHLLRKIGAFRISRFGIRANSIDALLKGEFQIIEINLFLPMPLMLISENMTNREKIRFCRRCMRQLALQTKAIPVTQSHKSVFFKKYKLSRLLKLTNKMRSYSEYS